MMLKPLRITLFLFILAILIPTYLYQMSCGWGGGDQFACHSTTTGGFLAIIAVVILWLLSFVFESKKVLKVFLVIDIFLMVFVFSLATHLFPLENYNKPCDFLLGPDARNYCPDYKQ